MHYIGSQFLALLLINMNKLELSKGYFSTLYL